MKGIVTKGKNSKYELNDKLDIIKEQEDLRKCPQNSEREQFFDIKRQRV